LSVDNLVEWRAEIVDRSVGVAPHSVQMHKILGHACSAHRSTDCAVHVQKTNEVVSEPLLLSLLECHPAFTPTTRLKHLLKKRPEQEFGLVKPTLKLRVQQ
jgi:hypothetical protein